MLQKKKTHPVPYFLCFHESTVCFLRGFLFYFIELFFDMRTEVFFSFLNSARSEGLYFKNEVENLDHSLKCKVWGIFLLIVDSYVP